VLNADPIRCRILHPPPQTAITHYSKAILIDPNAADAYNNRGAAYYELGEYSLANAGKTKACSLNSQFC
jgi:Flp pilus assembly protein TadD